MSHIGPHTTPTKTGAPAAQALSGGVPKGQIKGQTGQVLGQTQNPLNGFLNNLLTQLTQAEQANITGQKNEALTSKIAELQSLIENIENAPMGEDPATLSDIQDHLTGMGQLLDGTILAQLQSQQDIGQATLSLFNTDGTVNPEKLTELQNNLVVNLQERMQAGPKDGGSLTPSEKQALQQISALMQKHGLNTDQLDNLYQNAPVTAEAKGQTPPLFELLSQMSKPAVQETNTAQNAPQALASSNPAAAHPKSADAVQTDISAKHAAAGLPQMEEDIYIQNKKMDQSWRLSATRGENTVQNNVQKDGPTPAALQNSAALMAQMQAQAQNNTASNGKTNQAQGLFAQPLHNQAGISTDGGFDMMGQQQQGGQTTSDQILQATLTQQQNKAAEAGQKNGFAQHLQSQNRPHTTGKTIENLSLQIKKGMDGQNSQMRIQLHPKELGSVDIKMTFAEDGQVQAHLLVDKPETLQMLQKDSAVLEQSLKNAGLQLDQNDLHFDLNKQNTDTDLAQKDGKTANPYGTDHGHNPENHDADLTHLYDVSYIHNDRVNIWA